MIKLTFVHHLEQKYLFYTCQVFHSRCKQKRRLAFRISVFKILFLKIGQFLTIKLCCLGFRNVKSFSLN